MRTIFLEFVAPLILLVGCSPSTKITGTWKNPEQPIRNYHAIFVAALTGNTIAKSTLEKEVEGALMKRGIVVTKSMDEFPPNFEHDSLPRAELMKRVKVKGSEAILTLSIHKRETESRYLGGPYTPMMWGYYGNFWGYYNYWYPYSYSPGYYSREYIYYLEANLYNSITEELVWSAQSKTYSYDGLAPFAKEFASLMVSQMKKDGIINGIAKN
jgi:hypothetical protein